MRMQTQAPQQMSVKRGISIRTVVLILAVVVITLFAVKNWTLVTVWPLGPQKPLTLVIAISFVLGALIGWLAHSILFGRRPLSPSRNVMDEDDR